MLSVAYNQITDLNPLEALQLLFDFDVSYNKISNWNLFQAVNNIKKIKIFGNPISGLALPTHLIEKYQNLLSIPLNRQKAIEAVNLTYNSIGLKTPKVIFRSNYESWYTEIVNLLKSNNIPNQSRKSFILQKNRETIRITKLIFHHQLDFFHQLNNKIQNESIEELAANKLNNSRLIREITSLLYSTVRSLGFNVLDNSSLKKMLEAWNSFNNIITPEQIIHQIYLIEVYQSLLKITLDDKTQQWYDCLNQLLEHCGWFIPFEDVCIVCVKRSSTEGNRPSKFSLDSETRLHAEGEAAIQFADGYGLYYYRGVALPEKYGKVHPDRWQARWLLEEKNTELRRILIQAIGYNRICEELQAIQLDSWHEYDLIKIDADADVEPIVLLKMICPSTGYTHVLRVPPNMESAREAITWVNWDIDPLYFAVES